MAYRAPVSDIVFALSHAAGMDQGIAAGIYPELADGFAATLLSEAARFGDDILGPLNRIGDTHGTSLKDGIVTTAPGWSQAYRQWIDGGWNSLSCPASHGGQDMPRLVNAACMEMWSAANMAFTLCPLLSAGAVDAIATHGSEALKATYLEKLVTGEWTGTMNLTEPQAGSDLAALRSLAKPQADGSYRITGQKIYITYGEHDLTDNIVHLVLARLPDAPPGTRGISLFVVPKFLVNGDGSLGARNDVLCSGIEHKLGIHASPTCTMVFGDHGGAIGWLVGEENRGLNCMFTMMNNARLGTALQGVGLADAATQHAVHYANERRQGRSPGATAMSPIAEHPDIRRSLMTMRAYTQAARAICYATADAIDRSHRAESSEARKAAGERAALLTPVAKAFSSDIGNEVASIGVQVHGGMGYIEETGAAQYMRDVRIVAIYEGTNGIQAIDLVQRKLGLSGGQAVAREIADMRATLELLRPTNAPAFGKMALRLTEAVDAFERATLFLHTASPRDGLAGATPYLRLFGLARGGVSLAVQALAAHRLANGGDSDPAHAGRIATARFFAENLATAALGLETSIAEGGAFAAEPSYVFANQD